MDMQTYKVISDHKKNEKKKDKSNIRTTKPLYTLMTVFIVS